MDGAFLLAVTAGVTLVALAALFFSARRAITLCEFVIEQGKLTVVAGGLAPGVLSDLRDVARRERISVGSVRVLRAKDHARLEASPELSRAHLQMFRNVIGQVPVARLIAGAAQVTRAKKKKPKRSR